MGIRCRLRTTRTSPLHLVVLACLVVAAATGCGSGTPTESPGGSGGGSAGLDAAKQRGVLLVANTQANPPWNFVDEGNKPVGYDVDVANEVARRLGIGKVQFVAANFKSFIPGVQSGRYDVVISGQTITEERKKEVAFSRPYQVNGVSIFVSSGNNSVHSVADLTGKTITVTAGTTNEQWVRANVPSANVKTLQNATLALTDVALGRADASLVSKFQGTYLAQKNNLGVKPAGELLETEVNAMTFKKDDTALKNAVDKAIGDMLTDGTLTRISAKWLNGLDMAAELAKLPAQ